MALYGAAAVDYPDFFKGNAAVRWEGMPYVTGTAFSSHVPASTFFQPVLLPSPLAVAGLYVYKSLNASVPGATSQASSGSNVYSYAHGVSIFQRQDNGANSTNFTCVKTASGGLTASLSYTGTGQSFGMSWVTDSTGGLGTFSTASNAGNWSSYATGAKQFVIPINYLFGPGEYFFAHGHSSSSATSNSNFTLLSVSNLHIAPIVNTYGILGNSSASVASLAGPVGVGQGVASVVTTNATMAASVISAATVQNWVMNHTAF
jgi:hypothetical protein